MRTFENIADLKPLIGQEIAVSDWITVDQARIDKFADATGDHQWIGCCQTTRRAAPRAACSAGTSMR